MRLGGLDPIVQSMATAAEGLNGGTGYGAKGDRDVALLEVTWHGETRRAMLLFNIRLPHLDRSSPLSVPEPCAICPSMVRHAASIS